MWQRPRENKKSEDTIWYTSAPLGEKSLGGMVTTLLVKYKLSQRYTNHSIRVTSVQTLEDVNVEGRHIVRIRDHKSINSVQSYARRLSAARKRGISATFANYLSSAEHETSNKVLKIVNNNNSNDHDVTAKHYTRQMSVTMHSASCQSNPISVPGSNKNLIDVNVVDNVVDARAR